MAKKAAQQKTTRVPALLARTQFGQLLDRVAHNRERFVVTKKGEATAVILGIEDYLRTTLKTSPTLAALQEAARKSGADKLTWKEIEEEIEAVRREKTQQQG